MKNKNYWIWAGVIGLIALIAAYIVGSRTGKANKVAGPADQLAKEINTGGLSFELSQYETFAQKIHVAFSEIFVDKQTIYSVFTKLRSKDDVLQLIKTFGTRDLIFGIDNYTLPGWIGYSFNTSETEELNSILSRNNIDYQF